MYAVMMQDGTDRMTKGFSEFDAEDRVVFHRSQEVAEQAAVVVARKLGMPEGGCPRVWGNIAPHRDPAEPRNHDYVIVD